MGSFVVSGAGGTFDVVSPSSKISHWLHSPSVLHSCDAIESVLPPKFLKIESLIVAPKSIVKSKIRTYNKH